jgi:hypothetical protein
LSRWQKLRERMTEKVVVLMGGVAARDDTAEAAGVAPEASDRSLTVAG